MTDPRMSIVTKTGDDGTTGIVGGRRVSKTDPRLHAYGTVDELNALLGIVAAEDLDETITIHIARAQQLLFRIGADLATPMDSKVNVPRTREQDVKEIESWIDMLEPGLPWPGGFILPGGSRAGALLHHTRAVCRRAEREVVGLAQREEVNPHVRLYLNRFSDYLFLAAREENRRRGSEEIPVVYD